MLHRAIHRECEKVVEKGVKNCSQACKNKAYDHIAAILSSFSKQSENQCVAFFTDAQNNPIIARIKKTMNFRQDKNGASFFAVDSYPYFNYSEAVFTERNSFLINTVGDVP